MGERQKREPTFVTAIVNLGHNGVLTAAERDTLLRLVRDHDEETRRAAEADLVAARADVERLTEGARSLESAWRAIASVGGRTSWLYGEHARDLRALLAVPAVTPPTNQPTEEKP